MASMNRRRRRLFVLVLAATACALVLSPRVAPADIEEQRSRLPAPARCDDPVEGLWMSHDYFPHVGAWYVFVLDVRRTAPGARTLVGETRVEYWHAPSDRPQVPTACTPGLVHRRISAVADGTIDGPRFVWRGHTLGPETVVCGFPLNSYELVTFTGDIDFTREEFQNVLTAGPTWTDIRTVFRRIQCTDGTTPSGQPQQPVTPPPIQPPPPLTRGGCCTAF
jgi:hypothetical protein